MILKNHNDFNYIFNQDTYQAFVQAVDMLSLHCPVCGAVGIFTEDFQNDCKVQLSIQRIQCKNCKIVHSTSSLWSAI